MIDRNELLHEARERGLDVRDDHGHLIITGPRDELEALSDSMWRRWRNGGRLEYEYTIDGVSQTGYPRIFVHLGALSTKPPQQSGKKSGKKAGKKATAVKSNETGKKKAGKKKKAGAKKTGKKKSAKKAGAKKAGAKKAGKKKAGKKKAGAKKAAQTAAAEAPKVEKKKRKKKPPRTEAAESARPMTPEEARKRNQRLAAEAERKLGIR